jgi:microcystin-dependent protein
MAKISLPYTIINGDPVDAGPVESNYQTIENHANQELIERGGTVAMVAQLKLVGNPVAALDAAPKQYVDQMLPIGIITMFGGASAPPGGVWLACDNTEYEVVIYPELAAVLGNAASGKFRVPNLKDRFPVGSGGAYAANSTGGSADMVVPKHSHAIDHTHASFMSGIEDTGHKHPIDIMSVGSDRTLVTSSDGNHTHTTGQDGPLVQALGAGIRVGDGGGLAFNAGWSGTNSAGAHTHTVTDHLHGVKGDTGTESAYHKHGINLPAFTGASAEAGESGAGKNMPPYAAVLYVIRAK